MAWHKTSESGVAVRTANKTAKNLGQRDTDVTVRNKSQFVAMTRVRVSMARESVLAFVSIV